MGFFGAAEYDPAFDPDAEEVEQVEEQQEQQLNEEIDNELSKFTEEDSLLVEAERRFARAQYYQTLIQQDLFQDDRSDIAQEVLKDLREFARGRLTTLLGMTKEVPKAVVETKPVKLPFEEDEIKVLRNMARRLLKKPELADTALAPKPVLKPVIGPGTPQQPKPKANPGQALKKVVVAKPGPQKPAPKALQKANPKTQAKPKGPIQPTGVVMEIEHEVDGQKIRRKFTKFTDPRRGDFYLGENGQKYIMSTNEAGGVFMRNVTEQARPMNHQPQPRLTGDMMAAVAASQVRQAAALDPVASRIPDASSVSFEK